MSRKNKERKRNNRRERGGRLSRPHAPRLPAELPERVVRLEYGITDEPIDDDRPENKAMELIDEDDRERVHGLVYNDPRLAIPAIDALLNRYPGTAVLMNWLAAAHRALGEDDQADRIAEENYRLHPRYLFARLDYAELLLRAGRLDEIRAVFAEGFDLKVLYPHRDVFHTTEFSAFAWFMVRYLVRTGQHEAATVYAETLTKIMPDHPMTRAANDLLSGSILKRTAQRLLALALRRGIVGGR